MAVVWGAETDGVPPFDDPLDVQWFADAVVAHRDGIARALARGKPRPLFDVDPRSGDVLWEDWIAAFDDAVLLRPDLWSFADADAAGAFERLTLFSAIAHDESDLDTLQINALQDRIPGEIGAAVLALHSARSRDVVIPGPAAIAAPAGKVGRNDPCPCGSGRKSKRCCG
jgi:uncharacterized protein